LPEPLPPRLLEPFDLNGEPGLLIPLVPSLAPEV
jgi:hypothetical protein